MNAEDIVIAECVKHAIEDYARTEWIGTASSLESEIQDRGIISPPEQLWYASACAGGLQKWADINPQYAIGSYRVDFMIDPIGYFVNFPFPVFPQSLLEILSRRIQCFVVEIDGFEWHDKTPAQAEQDKVRERAIQHEGYRLFRYAAREILRDPDTCTAEMDTLVRDELIKTWKYLISRGLRQKKTVHDWPFEGVIVDDVIVKNNLK